MPIQSSYQKYNRELVTTITQFLGVSDTHITQGIKVARLPCRFEIMQNKPTVVLDGAHNRAKMETTLSNLKNLTFRKLYVIIGIADNKDHLSILEQIIPQADYVFFTRFQNQNRKCAHPKALLLKSKRYFKKNARSYIHLDPEKTLADVLKIAKFDDLILVTGSFYLAGELRKYWYPEDFILNKRKSF